MHTVLKSFYEDKPAKLCENFFSQKVSPVVYIVSFLKVIVVQNCYHWLHIFHTYHIEIHSRQT